MGATLLKRLEQLKVGQDAEENPPDEPAES